MAGAERFIGQPVTEATLDARAAAAQAGFAEIASRNSETMPPSPALVIDQEVRLPYAPSFVPLRFDVPEVQALRIPGQEVRLTAHEPTHLVTFMNRAGRVVAYIDQDGNYVKTDGPPPPPPASAPEPIVPPDLSGRIIDLG